MFALPEGRLASGYKDSTIRVWNIPIKECEKILNGHTLVRICDERLENYIVYFQLFFNE